MQSPRLCARPGCQSPAEATLRFHSTRREARLVDVDDGRPSSGDLCERHACVLALPRGWRLCDHRNLTVADPMADRVADPVAERAPEPAVALELAIEPEPEPEPEVVVEVPIAVEPEPVPAPLLVTEPDPGQIAETEADALSALLDAQTPLLKRAFRNAWPT